MIPVKQTVLALTFIVFGLAACNSSSQQDVNDINTTTAVDLPVTVDTFATEAITVTSKTTYRDTITYDYTYFPIDSTLVTKVLMVGNFHGDEVWDNASQMSWFGLFEGNDGYYLKQTKIKTTRVNDPIVDESEEDKTGWEVQALNKDTCLMLIEPLPFLRDRALQSVRLPQYYLHPDDTISFNYLGLDYKLFATGGKMKVQDDPEWYDAWNYKLYLTTTVKGKQHKSLLVAVPNFDDQMINLIFAGDIDGDGIVDLIIDTSRHYNMLSPTLYLSRPADKGEVVKPIGMHTSVGC
jgi:hypothetical protein